LHEQCDDGTGREAGEDVEGEVRPDVHASESHEQRFEGSVGSSRGPCW